MFTSRRRFAPTIFATVLTVLGVAGFVRLGFWQLNRAEEKRALTSQYTAGGQTTAELTAANAVSLPLYQRVHLRGHYHGEHHMLLNNMPSAQGRPGYRVVTPFELASGGWVLVDRGWVPLGATRSDLPDVAVDTTDRTIAGRLDALPRAGIELDDNGAVAAAPWPRVLNYPGHQAAEKAFGRTLITGLVLLDPDQADGYERIWEARFQSGPERHLAYAVQWFALAAAAIVIYLIVSLRRKEIDDRASEPGP